MEFLSFLLVLALLVAVLVVPGIFSSARHRRIEERFHEDARRIVSGYRSEWNLGEPVQVTFRTVRRRRRIERSATATTGSGLEVSCRIPSPRPEDISAAIRWMMFEILVRKHARDTFRRSRRNRETMEGYFEEIFAARARRGRGPWTQASGRPDRERRPPPVEPARPAWNDILGVRADASASEIRTAWIAKARVAHPDKGGSVEAMKAVNAARDEGLKLSR